MRLINSSFEILEQGPGLQGMYKQIELAGRTCYKSLDKITEDSAEGFVNRMIASQHYAMLEHGTVYLRISHEAMEAKYGKNSEPFSAYMDPISMLYGLECKYGENPYSKINHVAEDGLYVTTNYRVLVENGWLDDLQYLCEPTEHHERRVTVRFTTDRGVSHEFVRHRVFSFAQESTRYCNYSKDKFGNEIIFIIPSWMKGAPEGRIEWEGKDPMLVKGDERFRYLPKLDEDVVGAYDTLLALSECEYRYMFLTENNMLTAQQARQVLPNALKTELVMTGFISDWQHFFDLRARGTTGAPHPDAKALAEPLMHEFESKNLI